jgi:integrase/recombinase XerD
MITDWTERYHEDLERRGYAPRSIESYRHALRRFTDFLEEQGIHHPQEINPETIADYQAHLYTSLNRNGRPWALKTQSLHLVVIHGFMRFLVKRGALLLNPTEGIEMPRFGPRNPPRNIPSEEDVRSLIEAPDTTTNLGVRDRAILEVLYATGMRISELTGLTVYDVDLRNELVHIVAGKGGKDRVVPLGGMAAEAVRVYLEKVRPRYRRSTETNVLFLSSRGRILPRMSMGKRLKAYREKIGLTRVVTPHSFRHACATHMLRRQASIRHIQQLLGHKQLSTTQLYTQVEIEDLQEVHARTHPRENPDPDPASTPESQSRKSGKTR